MPEPIQQRRGPLLIAKPLYSCATGQMARNDRGALAVAFGQDGKEHRAPRALKRHTAAFIHDQQIDLHQALLGTP